MMIAITWIVSCSLFVQKPVSLQDFVESNGEKRLAKAMTQEQYLKLAPDQQLMQCVLEICSATKGTDAYNKGRCRLSIIGRKKLSLEVSALARDALAIRYLKTGDIDLEIDSLTLPIDGAYGDSYQILLIQRLVKRESHTRTASPEVKSIVRKLKSRMGVVEEEVVGEIVEFLRAQKQTSFVKSLLRVFSA